MGFFSKLFGKKEEKSKSDRTLAEAFHSTKDNPFFRNDNTEAVMTKEIRSDIAFQEPAYKRIKEIESKLQVSPDDFKDISFDIDVENITFGSLSEEAKNQIIEIVRNDRLNKLKNAVEDE